MNTETFQFNNAKQLLAFLKQFKESELGSIYLEGFSVDGVTVTYRESTLGDGSKITDLIFL